MGVRGRTSGAARGEASRKVGARARLSDPWVVIASRSAGTKRPRGPLPCAALRSIPFSRATFRTYGDARTRPPSAPSPEPPDEPSPGNDARSSTFPTGGLRWATGAAVSGGGVVGAACAGDALGANGAGGAALPLAGEGAFTSSGGGAFVSPAGGLLRGGAGAGRPACRRGA